MWNLSWSVHISVVLENTQPWGVCLSCLSVPPHPQGRNSTSEAEQLRQKLQVGEAGPAAGSQPLAWSPDLQSDTSRLNAVSQALREFCDPTASIWTFA